MTFKRVGDLMVPLDHYPRVFDWNTLAEAIAAMQRAAHNEIGRQIAPRLVLVFDVLGVLVGFLRRRDILAALEPDFMRHESLDYRKKLWDVAIDPNLSELNFDKLLAGVRERGKKSVTEAMRPLAAWVDHDAPLMTAVYALIEHDVSLLPVVQAGKVVGVFRTEDAFAEIAALVNEDR
ncbi:MAG: CBS domain-containing protein [Myxococcales bacterium]|nr:MAG: CBS domain-containing protein [Myxococcales bacterium]